MVELKDITIKYEDKTVLSGFNLTLPKSGFVCIEGPSGSGKTTLLRLLAGLIKPDKGEVIGLGEKRISMVFQEDRLLPFLTAYENIKQALPKETQDKDYQTLKWLTNMEIEREKHSYPDALSGGMQRRVAIARALAYGGDILLLDEAFAGLDIALRKRIAAHIKKPIPLIVVVSHESEDINLFEGAVRVLLG